MRGGSAAAGAGSSSGGSAARRGPAGKHAGSGPPAPPQDFASVGRHEGKSALLRAQPRRALLLSLLDRSARS